LTKGQTLESSCQNNALINEHIPTAILSMNPKPFCSLIKRPWIDGICLAIDIS
jgi:hypothetical protein